MQRRDFLSGCAASCAALALPAGAAARQPRLYNRVLLTDADGAPLRAASLTPERNYVFHYPFAATPCFLLDMGRSAPPYAALRTADDHSYRWPGGVGPRRSIVAYSAICAHKLTYPTREISFIRYRAETTPHSRIAHVIHCCSEHSQYDPARGAAVVAGPAPQPLAAILLEHDATRDELHAVGTLGGEMFDEFFSRFAFRLALEHGGDKASRAVTERAPVLALDNFCRQQVRC